MAPAESAKSSIWAGLPEFEKAFARAAGKNENGRGGQRPLLARKRAHTIADFEIVDVEITDRALYGKFLERVTAMDKDHGGKLIDRGGKITAIEGSWKPKRIALLEFASAQAAREWLDSPEFTALGEIRTKSSNINMVLVDG